MTVIQDRVVLLDYKLVVTITLLCYCNRILWDQIIMYMFYIKYRLPKFRGKSVTEPLKILEIEWVWYLLGYYNEWKLLWFFMIVVVVQVPGFW